MCFVFDFIWVDYKLYNHANIRIFNYLFFVDIILVCCQNRVSSSNHHHTENVYSYVAKRSKTYRISLSLSLYSCLRFTGSPLNSVCARKPVVTMSKPTALVCCRRTVNCCTHSAKNRNCVHSSQPPRPYNRTKTKNTSPSTTWRRASKMPRRNSVAGCRPCRVHSRCASTHTPNALRSWTLWTNWKRSFHK